MNADRQQAMQAHRCNDRYLPGIRLPANIKCLSDLGLGVEPGTVYLLVVPSHAFRTTLRMLRSAIEERSIEPATVTLLWGTKGMETESGFLMSQVIDEVWDDSSRQGVLSGPSFAGEVARGLPTALTLAATGDALAQEMADCFRQDTVRIYHHTDLLGVQLGGTIKNVMAIATGISDGLGLGANARAALMTRGLAELMRLGRRLGGRTGHFHGTGRYG